MRVVHCPVCRGTGRSPKHKQYVCTACHGACTYLVEDGRIEVKAGHISVDGECAPSDVVRLAQLAAVLDPAYDPAKHRGRGV